MPENYFRPNFFRGARAPGPRLLRMYACRISSYKGDADVKCCRHDIMYVMASEARRVCPDLWPQPCVAIWRMSRLIIKHIAMPLMCVAFLRYMLIQPGCGARVHRRRQSHSFIQASFSGGGISRLISTTISLSADPNTTDLLQRVHPQILAGIGVG